MTRFRTLICLSLVLAFAAGLVLQTWHASPSAHAVPMAAMDHDMSAMPASGSMTQHDGALSLCKQHCLAVAALLPAAPMAPALVRRATHLALPDMVLPLSIQPAPTGPPPKALA